MGFTLFLAEKQVDEPAATNMFALRPAMGKNLLVIAASLLQSIRQHCEPRLVQQAFRQDSFVVDGLSQFPHLVVMPCEPAGADADFAERQRAEEVAEQVGLGRTFPKAAENGFACVVSTAILAAVRFRTPGASGS
jgi:hypothetical protein